MHKKIAIFLFSSLVTYSISAQTTNSLNADYQKLQKIDYLFNDGQYSLAQELLENYIQKDIQLKNTDGNVIHAQMMRCLCAIRLELPNAMQLAERFLQDYPMSTEKNYLNYELANDQFNKGNYDKAIHYFEQCDAEFLQKDKQDKFHIYSAYSLFKQGKVDLALNKFDELTKSNNQFKYDAHLYKGLIYFAQKEWLNAFHEFEIAKDHLEADQWAVYYAQSLYNLKRYKETYAFADKTTGLSTENAYHLNMIEGMAYNQSGKHEKAINTLEKLENLPSDAQYALGYSLLKLGRKTEAKEALLKVATNPNPDIYQNAQFLLAKVALETDQKAEAITALKKVIALEGNKKVTENAHYQIIKLSFEHDDIFTDTEELIFDFTQKYPSSIYLEEVYDILTQNYVKKKQYSKAISTLEDLESKHIRLKRLYQEICLFRGIQLYNTQNYNDAITFFNKSIQEPVNKSYTDKAKFWTAESYYQKGDYDAAISHYLIYDKIHSNKNVEENKQVYYNLAYTYFNKSNYSLAIKYWDKYLNHSNLSEPKKVDAFLRLGDANMMVENYSSAKTYFRKASIISGDHADYAAYSEAVCNRLLDDFPGEISILMNFDRAYPHSIYKDDAKFQLAEAYLNKYKYEEARIEYKDLLKKYPKSEFYSTSELKLAIINYNQNLNELALQDFKAIVAKYPNTPVSKEAIRLIRNIYFDIQQPQEYHNYLAELDIKDESKEGLDDYSYFPAHKQFTKGDYLAAQNGFEFYLKKYPNGIHKNEAHYYLAECYIKTENLEKAEESLQEVANSTMGELSEDALLKLAKINYNKQDYNKSLDYYQQLFDHSRYQTYTQEAQIGLMQTNYKLGNYQDVMKFATKILNLTNIDEKQKSNTRYLLAISAFENHSYKIAKDNFKHFLTDYSPQQAEAHYYMLQILNNEEEFHQVIAYIHKNIDVFKNDDQRFLYPSLMLYGHALTMVNNRNSAITAYNGIIEKCKDEKIVNQAKEALSKLQ